MVEIEFAEGSEVQFVDQRQTRIRVLERQIFDVDLGLARILSAYPRQREAYSYDFADLARHWNDYDRSMLFWHARHGARIRLRM